MHMDDGSYNNSELKEDSLRPSDMASGWNAFHRTDLRCHLYHQTESSTRTGLLVDLLVDTAGACLDVESEGVPETQEGSIPDKRSVVATTASCASSTIPFSRYLLIEQLAVHVHLVHHEQGRSICEGQQRTPRMLARYCNRLI